ncbi:squalene synthase HpnC [Enterovirga sp.]|uniref:squalene synthase HpnC n=1 Tax=Enterovirga sp. TaxID=2026350 RepID=UPI002635A3E9|nr:squalene synthase HpnC [Enterovirga sp.]MDB5591457.1 squalene synthase HpnC [Enterovirga sp.]
MTTTATAARSGKGHTDENFPVARLVSARHRGPILAFYRFVRAADDVSDHPTMPADAKLRLLDGLEAALLGRAPPDPEAEPLRLALAERGLPATHAQDLLEAFRLDSRKNRYRSWDELMGYCALSAMPVGRFVLDVHGESRATWAASDPLCAALQVINHLQDCGKDARELDRVYLTEDALSRHGATVADLSRPRATPGLLAAIRELNEGAAGLLRASAVFPGQVRDLRLGLEVSVIQALAEALVATLRRRDPLSERVHATKAEALRSAGAGILRALWQRRPGTGAIRAGATA